MSITNNKATVTCNKCGKSLEFTATQQNTYGDIQVIEGEKWDWFHSICINAGYPSKYDNHPFEFHLCDDCLEELIDSFKVKIDIERGVM